MHKILSIAASVVLAAISAAQKTEAVYETRIGELDSGHVGNDTAAATVVFRHAVRYDQATWLRLDLDGTNLPKGSRLHLTALYDGAVQRFDGLSLAAYGGRSAYFNGNEVLVELVASPGSTGNRVRVARVEVGAPPAGGPESLCGADDRVLSSDPRQGRQYPTGCTSWLISESVVLTAGHCTASAAQQVHFNVPLSTSSGSLQFPPPEDQYPYDTSTLQRLDAGVGADWAVVRTVRNSNTGLYPGERQGSWYSLGAVPGSTAGQVIRITGYGTTSSPVSPTWNQVQKTHADALTLIASTYLRYIPDTTGGNSGSPVLHENTGLAIGIHTHAGCTSGGNQGTRIDRADLQQAIANLLGGGGAPTPPSDLVAGASVGRIDLSWADNSSNEQSFSIERSTDGNSFAPHASVPANTTGYADQGLPGSTTFWYRVQAINGTGASAFSNVASATTPGGATDQVATAETTVTGTASGSFAATHAADGVLQSITEVYTGGNRPRNRLEHRWTIAGVPSAGTRTFMVMAHRTASSDGDSFRFQYQSGSSWVTMVTVSNTAPAGYASYVLPGSIIGDVVVRVIDTNSSRGAVGLDSVRVDHLLIRTQ
jgi:V8-like Glu-specific endopeptidase